MAYTVTRTKEASLEQLKVLIHAFWAEYAEVMEPDYKETPLRNDYINPLLKTFGWDVENETGSSQYMRDVLQEETIGIEEDDTLAKKNPDYTLRVQGTRKIFIEAKKASIDIEKSKKSAFQTRRYGWNANLGISILTNFDKIIVYDCRYKPAIEEDASTARYRIFHYDQFVDQFDSLYQVLSFDSIASGFIDDYFSLTEHDAVTFDNYFLKQIETWRHRLATEIVQKNAGFKDEDINFLIQRLLNRIVFLRICEDREIEKYETLKGIKSYNGLKTLFVKSDKRYNSGLFDFIEDHFSLKISVKSDMLIEIFSELYYPESPYDFSVIDPTILSQIYERYLGSKVSITTGTKVSIVEEPEVTHSSGVVPTPKLVVENIVKETLAPLFEGKSLKEIQALKIADICCGSGTFLLSVYDNLLEKLTLAYQSEGVSDRKLIRQSANSAHLLSLKAKQSILVDNIYGVDINPYAVEVTKFSLLLKFLENENAASVDEYLKIYSQGVLPSLDKNVKTGNSLVDSKYFEFSQGVLQDDEILYKVKPFEWADEFPFFEQTKGFDAVVGNPPYIRIQNMVKYQAEEIKYYQNDLSGYTVGQSENFDKYYLFVQRALNLLNPTGILGYIVPNKFFILKGGKVLREYISSVSSIRKIIHFGVTQVFPNRSTYTAIIILDRQAKEQFDFRRVRNLAADLNYSPVDYVSYLNSAFKDQPWIFVSKDSTAVFEKMKNSDTIPLNTIAEIPVGLQTSADNWYIFEPFGETDHTFKFLKTNIAYEIERAICKPCLYDLSFDLFDTVEPNAQLIFPYSLSNDKAEVFSEDHMSSTFPLAWSYLNSIQDKLSKRNINGSKNPKWYQFGRSQSLTKFQDRNKLIWPVLSLGPNYIYDSNNLQFTGGGNGPYYSLISNSEYSPLFILGILSHPVIEAIVKSGASEFRGEYYSHGKQFIERLPIKKIDFQDGVQKQNHDEVVKITEQLILAKQRHRGLYRIADKRASDTKINFLSARLTHKVNLLYGITKADIDIVLSDDMFLINENES